MNEKELLDQIEKVTCYFISRYKSKLEHVDDFRQFAAECYLSGRSLKTGWNIMCIDYFRKYGDSFGKYGSSDALSQRNRGDFNDRDNGGAKEGLDLRDTSIEISDPTGSRSSSQYVRRLGLTAIEEAVYNFFIEGLTGREISKILGVTNGRISQRLNRIKKKMEEAVVLEEAYAIYTDHKDASVLKVDWIKL